MRRNFIPAIALFAALASPAFGEKLDVMAGAFHMSASSSITEGTITNLGAYRVAFSQGLTENLEASLGYTVLASGIITGDLAYGFDVGVAWFPFSENRSTIWQGPNQTMEVVHSWRPYVGISFNQRQFQVVQTGYAGFGGSFGVEKPINARLAFKGEFRGVFFAAADEARATELDVFFGLSFGF